MIEVSMVRKYSDQPIPVSVVSNSLLIRDGIVGILASHIALVQVGSYTLDAQIHAPSKLPEHIILIDGNCERSMLIEYIRQCRELSVARTFICELDYNVDLILDCIEAGAGGYSLKSTSAQELASALNAMRNNQAQCHPEVAARLFARLSDIGNSKQPLKSTLPDLTRREWEVLGYLSENCSNQQIASALRIEVRTVKHHVHNILEKLGLTSRYAAARFATEQGLQQARPGRTPPILSIVASDHDV